ncbi:hypothetical protein F5141DRAFT_1063049 [Pisolithus sp. B1]|nr:hypothetical protein F5141DRAFT_1063049 [Pisolithus sp. B1]
MWLRGQPKLTCNGNSETPTKVEARMLAHLEKLGKESCQATHCHNKYKWRMAVLDYVVQLRTEVSDDDLTAWKWLQHLVKTLGEQGMSSEESAVENEIEQVLHVKRMEWQRCIDCELDIIDVDVLSVLNAESWLVMVLSGISNESESLGWEVVGYGWYPGKVGT